MNIASTLQAIIRRLPEKVYQKGQWLYGDGEMFQGLFVVMAGAVKGYSMGDEGDARVTGFYLPGEWLGFEGLPSGPYSGYAQALGTCCARWIPISMLAEFSLNSQGRQAIFFQMSDTIRKNKIRYYQMSQVRAGARLALFIQDLSVRISHQGYSAREFFLPMTRGDIASYLGVTPETISRAMASLECLGILRLKNRYITLLQPDKLGLLQEE